MKTRFRLLKSRFKYHKYLIRALKIIFWFFLGALLSFSLISSFSFFVYQNIYQNKIYPGVYVDNFNLGGKTKEDAKKVFTDANYLLYDSQFVLTSDYGTATVSAREIEFGYDKNLSVDQAYTIGRSDSILSNVSLILQAYIGGIRLPATYTYNQDGLLTLLKPVSGNIDKNPVDALFKFENNKVSTFRPSENGQTIDTNSLHDKILAKTLIVISSKKPRMVIIPIPIKIIQPAITTDKANKLGIKELIGVGNSLFYHSIPGRIYNINLAASRLNGILVAPGEVFSFDKALGDVSAFTGYRQAYIIQNGKTILGDGGGVCQVSTTFFRALLNAGLPIVERNAHAYRVGYYEEDSGPGFDATIFVPSVDLKFKNDTGNYILIQSQVDLDNLSLTFNLYGASDGREVKISNAVISNQSPPPPDLYQDDPTLPKGEIKQTDFAAWGANVYFTRTVTKNNQTIISDKFVSNYRPWQAIYLRGTKE